MLYLNREKEFQKIVVGGVVIEGLRLGERGRGRSSVFLPIPRGSSGEGLEEGLYEDLALGESRSGNPRICLEKREGEKGVLPLYLILSTAGGYTRRGCGSIQVLKSQAKSIVINAHRAKGADGDAGRIGNWDELMLKIPNLPKSKGEELLIKINLSGGRNPELLLIPEKGEAPVKFASKTEYELY